MRLFTLVIICLIGIVFPNLDASTCTNSKIDTLKGKVNTRKNALDGTSSETRNSIRSFVNGLFADSEMKDCQDHIESLPQTLINSRVKYQTDQCREANTTSPAFLQNPCCNGEMLERHCCQFTELEEVQTVVKSFKSSLPNCNPNDGSMLRQLVRHYYRLLRTRKQVCEKKLDLELRNLEKLRISVEKCYERIHEEKECVSNNDCYSGICRPDDDTEPLWKKCAPASKKMDFDNALVKCLREYLPENAIRIIQKEIGLSSNSDLDDETITKELMKVVGNDACVELNHDGGIVRTAFTSKSTCEAQKKCNDGSNTCSNGDAFCGARFGINGVAAEVLDFETKQECDNPENAIGTCRADRLFHVVGINVNGRNTQGGLDKLHPRADCTSHEMCSISTPACRTTCDADTCMQIGYCHGFPTGWRENLAANPDSQRCVRNYTISGTFPHLPSCPDGEEDLGYGCLMSTDRCATGVSGRNVGFPSGEESCTRNTQPDDTIETVQLMVTCDEGNGRYSGKYAGICTSCGHTPKQLYRWEVGTYTTGTWTKSSQWKNREEVPLYVWTKALDQSKFNSFVSNKVIRPLQDLVFKAFLSCSTDPLFDSFSKFVCSCSQGNGCFNGKKFPTGYFTAYPNALASYDFADAKVTIFRGSVSSTKEVRIDRVPLYTEPNHATLPQDVEVEKFVVIQDDRIVAQISGDGLQFNQDFDEPIELCLKVDDQFNLTTGLNTPYFATIDSDGEINVEKDIKLTPSTSSHEICGEVTQGSVTYYPAVVRTSHFRFREASGSLSTLSFASCMIAVILSFAFLL